MCTVIIAIFFGMVINKKKFKFRIKKGDHYSITSILHYFRFKMEDKLHFDFIIDESCRYQDDGENATDFNKLYGVSLSRHHHINSIRIGWRYYKEKLEICAYLYREGERKIVIYDKEIEFNNKYNILINFTDRGYNIYLDYSAIHFERSLKSIKVMPIKYILKPYFGGDNTAPHNMLIEIKLLS